MHILMCARGDMDCFYINTPDICVTFVNNPRANDMYLITIKCGGIEESHKNRS